jgi:hypothetical protein
MSWLEEECAVSSSDEAEDDRIYLRTRLARKASFLYRALEFLMK